IDVGQTSVAKYMLRRRRPPSQSWKTFLANHADGIAAMDLFVVPTISFQLLYGLLILRHDRRQIIWFGVTEAPDCRVDCGSTCRSSRMAAGAEIRAALRDRDRAYGAAFSGRMKAKGIRDHPISPRSPWQNACAA